MSVTLNREMHCIAITPRVERLRHAVVHAKPILCSERAKLATESYKETEDLPAAIRRGKLLDKVLNNITLNIWDDELIVGSHGSNGRRSAPVFLEFAIKWLEEELDEILETREQDTFDVPAQVKADLKELFPYWQGKTVFDYYRAMLPEEAKKARDAYMFSRDLFERNGYGHTAYDLPKLFKVGVNGLKQEMHINMSKLDLTDAEDLGKQLFYEGTLLCCDAVIGFGKRYAAKALAMAEQETRAERKQELKKIADVCAHVAEHPARDTWDCLQMVQFMQLVFQLETSGDSISPGRLDQYVLPYYLNDLKQGTYTQAQIQDLLDCLWVKFNEIVKAQDTESIFIHPGFPMTPNLTVGGVTPEGADAVNDLSYMMLTAQEHVCLTNPQFTARIAESTPNDFKLRCAEVIRLGTGMPALFGDNACIASIQKHFPDMPIERVRDYRIVGCVELSPRGFQGRVNGGQLNVARVVDLAINNGVDRLTGKQLGPQTGNADNFITFKEFMAAVRKQMDYFVRMQVINAAVVDIIQRDNTPHLFLSALIEGCLENGKDLTSGGSLWGRTPILHAGLATAANSAVAIKKLIFEEHDLSFADLNQALSDNFETESAKVIRKKLLAAPKYGNDDDYADSMMRDVSNLFFTEIEKYKDIDGRYYTSMILTLGGTIPHGWKTGATADGRRSTTPVSDSMSPVNGSDHEGPTAVALSASKIDQTRTLEGNVLNLKFSKSSFGEGEFSQKFVDLFSTYLTRLNGQEIQFNVVNTDDLRKAQVKPDDYKDLIIRVAGYSARFVELSQELQNDIIDRTEQETI